MNSEYIEVNFSDIIISTHVYEMWGLLNFSDLYSTGTTVSNEEKCFSRSRFI